MEAGCVSAKILKTWEEHLAHLRQVLGGFPDRRTGTGLYAFVEGSADDSELNEFLGRTVPEHLQVVEALPRNAEGEVRSEILELVAMNQLDLIGSLIKTDAERAIVGRIVSQRRNLQDRFAF